MNNKHEVMYLQNEVKLVLKIYKIEIKTVCSDKNSYL